MPPAANVDPVYYHGGKYVARSVKPVARVKPEAYEIADRDRGSVGVLLNNYGAPQGQGEFDPKFHLSYFSALGVFLMFSGRIRRFVQSTEPLAFNGDPFVTCFK